MSTIWKTSLDGVAYESVWDKWAVVRLLPGAVKPDPANPGIERGIIQRLPFASLSRFIGSGEPWQWCTDEEFFSQDIKDTPAKDTATTLLQGYRERAAQARTKLRGALLDLEKIK